MKQQDFEVQYAWLFDALRDEADWVKGKLYDHDTGYLFGYGWNSPSGSLRHGIKCRYEYGIPRSDRVEHDYETDQDVCPDGYRYKTYDLNRIIASGRLTREQVVAAILAKRPSDWVPSHKLPAAERANLPLL